MEAARNDSELWEHTRALQGAIEHIRAAKGVLDTYPGTRREAEDVELVAQKLEKKVAPLQKRLAEQRARLTGPAY